MDAYGEGGEFHTEVIFLGRDWNRRVPKDKFFITDHLVIWSRLSPFFGCDWRLRVPEDKFLMTDQLGSWSRLIPVRTERHFFGFSWSKLILLLVPWLMPAGTKRHLHTHSLFSSLFSHLNKPTSPSKRQIFKVIHGRVSLQHGIHSVNKYTMNVT